jgi:hypothetical protein
MSEKDGTLNDIGDPKVKDKEVTEMDAIDIEDELDKIVEAIKLGMDTESISMAEGLQVNTLCAIATLLVQLSYKVDDANEKLTAILKSTQAIPPQATKNRP